MSELNDQMGRGTFPPHWGAPPTFGDSPQRRQWIADNCRREDSARGRVSTRGMSPRQRQVDLLGRREDPSATRERARVATRNRLRHEELAALLLRCP